MSAHRTLLRNIYNDIAEPLLLILFAGAVVVFLWGLVELIRGADSETARAKGKQHIIWGIIGMVIMASAFGIINIVADTLETASGDSSVTDPLGTLN